MQEWLVQFTAHYPHLVYGVIIISAFIEGPILALICGLLIRLGDLPILPVYFALMAGDLLGDIIWYSIGYYFGHPFIQKYGHFFSITEEGIAIVEKIFHKYKSHILIISKLTMGFGFALVTLITAGIVKIPFKRYLALNFLGQFFWTAFLLLIGSLFGNLYLSVNGFLAKMSIGGLFVIAFIALIGFGRFVKKRMTKSIETI